MIKFGTGGFRGVIADDFNKNNVKLIAQAISDIYLEKKANTPVYVGYDYRFMSDIAGQWVSEVLAGNNIPVILSAGPNTTPEIMTACKNNRTDFGIMITSSHNPNIYNGIKVFQEEGMDAEASLTNKIEKKVNSLKSYKSLSFDEALAKGLVVKKDLLDDFISNIGRFVSPSDNNLKVLIDPIYGTGSITLGSLMKLMKINDVVFVNNTHDPLFGSMVPNPTKQNMSRDADLVRKDKYDLAIGTDSDCDRLGVLDEQGNYVDANEILASLYYYLVKYRGEKGDIVKNLATSNLIDKVADKLGYKCHEVDVGFKNISSAIKKYDALIGGESSGGLTIRNYIFGKDSTFSTALFLEMVCKMNKPVSEIIKEVRDFANFHYVILEDEMRFTSRESIINTLEGDDPIFTMPIKKKVHIANNYKYYFEDGSWALLRFSGTEPVIRIFVEMNDEETGNENIHRIRLFVKNIDNGAPTVNLKETVISLFKQIHDLKNNPNICELPDRTYILEDDKIVCKNRKFGESRFPYGFDGFYLWANSSGYISANESTFYTILPTGEGREPYVNYYAGIKHKEGYNIVSLLGCARFATEIKAKRYTVYSKASVYYLTECDGCYFCVRIYVNEKKEINTTVIAINADGTEKDIYLSSYQNYLFKYEGGESIETKWFKKCTRTGDTFLFESPEDLDRLTHINNFGLVRRLISKPAEVMNTTSKSDYKGGKNYALNDSHALKKGFFKLNRDVTHFTDTAIVGDIIHHHLVNDIRVDYVVSSSHELEELPINNKINTYNLDKEISMREEYYLSRKNEPRMINFNFKDWKNNNINHKSLNKFIDNVIYQVEYCALAKNSGAIFLGVRDVIQQLEALLMWNPKAAKAKILEVLGVIDPSGNPPRQYSIPPVGVKEARMDLRPFIDQSVWIISTIYTYLAYTGDYDFLNDKCSYFEINGPRSAVRCDFEETVLEHMIRIMGYLESKIDYKYTNCLRTIYGDWNDALDGLGGSLDGSEEYGSGVSVMASAQYYQNLNEMIDILKHLNIHSELISKYETIRSNLVEGLLKYAIHEKDGKHKIVHGWGDKVSYYVGSFDDIDHESRDSLASNAFFVLSDMIKYRPELEHDILNAYTRLDSKYGLKTFEPYFKEDCPGVGRIVHLPKGTAENGATYVHATLFGIDALFALGHGDVALSQFEKIIPLTHKSLSTTTFIMSNSYVYNPEENMDGESMNDWYTGSATVTIKSLVHSLFGVRPNLDGVDFVMSKDVPSNEMSLRVLIKGSPTHINYINKGKGKRTYLVNNEPAYIKYDEQRKTEYIYLDNKTFDGGEITIDIID